MATFTYTAITAEGRELGGTVAAADLAGAFAELRRRGLLADRLVEVEESAGRALGSLLRTVRPRSLQIFSRQFATMIESGLNVVASLSILEEQTNDAALADVIVQLREDVEQGLLLSEAMARHPKAFGRLYVAMVEAGEAAGVLDVVLDRVAVQLEKEQQIRRRVKSAMMYPTIVLVFATLVLIGMLLFLVPVFVKIFAQLNGQLPTLTRYVVGVSDLMRGRWYVVFPLLAAIVVGFFRWKASENGRPVWDRLRLHFPLRIGDTVLKVTMARFSRTLSTLVAAGVDILQALEITGQTSGNHVVETALADVRSRVREGASIAQPLIENEVFPPMVSQMVRVGEETGELEKMLGKIADFYEDEVEAAIASLTSIVEPLMMIAVGFVVGIILIAMYLPMFKMLTLVANSSGG